MKLARGIHLAAAGALAVLGVAAATAPIDTGAPTSTDASRTTAGSGPTMTGDATGPGARSDRPAPATPSRISPTTGTAPTGPAVGTTPSAGAATTALAGRAAPRFDVDGDGRDELILPAMAEGRGLVLVVRYDNLTRRQVLTPPATPVAGRQFVQRYTAGDFNGDGFQDVAIASQRIVSPGVFEHGIFVFPGSAAGLSQYNVTYLAGLQAGDLASGDLDNDGRDELAVTDGGANETRDGAFHGSVTVLAGTATGLSTTGAQRITQVVPRVPGQIWESFGNHLAIGDHTGDGYADLIVAGSRRTNGESDVHGMLTLFKGSAQGVQLTGVSKLEGQLDIPGTLPVDTMALADFNLDGRDELILGLPRHGNGEVVYLPGGNGGLTATGRRTIHLDTTGVPGTGDDDADGSHFGWALATGDANGDGRPDLLVGAITDNVGTVSGAGSVILLPGTAQGPTGAGALGWAQSADAPTTTATQRLRGGEPAEENDNLGSAVALLDLDGTGGLELFAEARYEDISELTGSYGLVVQLQVVHTRPQRGATGTGGAHLRALGLYRPADFSTGEFRIIRTAYGLLAG